jgi:hypothetical protein
MKQFSILQNQFLNQEILAFYHTDYLNFKKPGNPDFLNYLKNNFNHETLDNLNSSVTNLTRVLNEDLPKLLQVINKDRLTVCVVPRSKSLSYYQPQQLLFKSSIAEVIRKIPSFIDGVNFIKRHTDTKTTHLHRPIQNFPNEGKSPYPGITKDTCTISSEVQGMDILLIDDIYTKSINIDEDAIQALIDNGCNSVSFYAVGRTVFKG